jgi:hypothetical protein
VVCRQEGCDDRANEPSDPSNPETKQAFIVQGEDALLVPWERVLEENQRGKIVWVQLASQESTDGIVYMSAVEQHWAELSSGEANVERVDPDPRRG